MSRRLTASELSEPDVTLVIPYAKWDALPQGVRDTLRFWVGKDTGAAYVYTVPAYRVREFEELAQEDARSGAVVCPSCGASVSPHVYALAGEWNIQVVQECPACGSTIYRQSDNDNTQEDSQL